MALPASAVAARVQALGAPQHGLTPLLVPLDGSMLAERALPVAAWLSTRLYGRSVLMRVGRDDITCRHCGQLAQAAIQSYLEQATSRSPFRGGVEQVVATGKPADEIVRQARMLHAGVVIMATHGHMSGRLLLHESVAEAVLRASRLPVILIPPGAALSPPTEKPRMLVALDGSTAAETVLSSATELTQSIGGELLLVRVVRPCFPFKGQSRTTVGEAETYLSTVTADLRRRLPERVAFRILRGSSSADAIVQAAAREGATIIAMATRNRDGGARLMHGSMLGDVVRQACCPVLVVEAVAHSSGWDGNHPRAYRALDSGRAH